MLLCWFLLLFDCLTFIFPDGILDMEDTSQQDLAVFKAGRRTSRQRATTAAANDCTIKSLTADLLEGNISVKHFLKGASYTVVRALDRGLKGQKKKKRKNKNVK